MMRRLLVLNGVAALMVVLNHTASYGFNAMFFWADRYREVSVPTYEAIGTIPYYILFAVHHLVEFAIPAFLFVSGYFIAFTAKTSAAGITMDLVFSRIKKLIFPFIIWSILVNVILLRRLPPTAEEVLQMYYYIPLIAQYYLLSPIIIRIAKKHWLLLLIGAGLLQLSVEFVVLFRLLEISFPGQEILALGTPVWLFPGRIFYFCVGVVASLNQQRFTDWILKYRWAMFASMVSLFALLFVEYSWVSKLTGIVWLVPRYSGVIKTLFAMAMVLCFFAFPNLRIPFDKWLSDVGGKSFGIYLVNTPAIFVVAYAMYYVTPWALGYQIIYQPVLIAAGLGIPLVLMAVFKKPRVRRIYPLIFG